MEELYSHYRITDNTYQTNREHQHNVAKLCEIYCQIPCLKKIAYLTGLHHDDGKNTDEWQSYFRKKIQDEQEGLNYTGEKVDHSTLGGIISFSYVPGSMLSEMAEAAIYTHHGTSDCVSVIDGETLLGKRRKKFTAEQVIKVREICEREQDLSEKEMADLFGQARQDLKGLIDRLKKLPYDGNRERMYGNGDFYLGMCERLLFSVLADGDMRDTVDFMENCRTITRITEEKARLIWQSGLAHLEEKLAGLKEGKCVGSPLNQAREEISASCERAAYSDCSRYRLAVPTGAGKTLSALRFALRRAYETGKRHIFYIAPFRSILDQNADEIKDAVGNQEWVLEHHGDVVFEDEEEYWKFERLIENWDEVPIITTTAVQFFQTLYGEKKRNLRRFHSLCNSILIFDEVQALPIKVMGLFNLAVNFLTEIAGSTVVLCTATQPPFEKIVENRMKQVIDMTKPLFVYEPQFRRVTYHDCTDGGKRSLGIQEASELILEKAESEKQVLAIFNTKGAAREIFEILKGHIKGKLFHLSTSMCAEHRTDVLKEIRKALYNEEEIVCISTQLVEAGVDFSFRCVIRSLAGLDNLIQAAGRCNRNGGTSMGHVYVIQMDEVSEQLSRLPDIRRSQEATRKLLRVYQECPKQLDNRLDSEKAIQAYYREYLLGREAEERYPVRVEGVSTDLIELLSGNRKFAPRQKKIFLKQAFRTAGEQFSLINETGGIDVAVPYQGADMILEKLSTEEDRKTRKQLLRKLQRYTVNLSDSMIKKMGDGAIHRRKGGLLILDRRYYDENIGAHTEPGEMEFLSF